MKDWESENPIKRENGINNIPAMIKPFPIGRISLYLIAIVIFDLFV